MTTPKTSFFSLPTRKIRVDIITLFLLLVTISSLTIITYSTYRNNKSTLLLSNAMIEQVGGGIVEKIAGIIHQSEMIPEQTQSLINSNSDICIQNNNLISYLINLINLEPYISSINIAGINGDTLSVYNAPLAKITHFSADPTKALPELVKYAIRGIERTTDGASEIWQYKGTDGALLGNEKLNSSSYDPRMESWFVETANWRRLRWSSVRTNLWGEPIITVSVPSLDESGKLIAVIGVNLSLNQLSNFVAHLKVGLTGQVFIVSEDEIIIPPMKKLQSSHGQIPEQVIARAYEKFKETKKKSFLIKEMGSSYFTYFASFPLTYETKWLIAMLIPYEDFFGGLIQTQHQTLLISLLLLVLFAILVFFSSKYIASPIVELSSQVDRIKQFDFEDTKPLDSRIEEIMSLQSSISATRKALRAFSLYVPKEIVRTLIQRGEGIKLGGERREVTLLFTDIENFTSLSETLTIDQLTSSLGAYFDVFSKVIIEEQGTIDKYIGDSVMAFWGAPSSLADHADKACLTALRSLKVYEKELKENKQLPPWRTRMGIHTGEVVVGNIGTAERMNYTAIGSTVNMASRLQSMNKEYKTEIIISESVLEKIGARYITRPLDFVTVKGKQNKITIYELVGAKGVEGLIPGPEKMDLCEAFTSAYTLFHQGLMREAKSAFQALNAKFPSDIPTKLYLERLEKM
jgi:adenylate cyclase